MKRVCLERHAHVMSCHAHVMKRRETDWFLDEWHFTCRACYIFSELPHYIFAKPLGIPIIVDT